MNTTEQLEQKLAEHRQNSFKVLHRIADCLALFISERKCNQCADKWTCRKVSDYL